MVDFEKIRLNQIIYFLQLLANVKSRDLIYLQRLYRNNAENFDETLKYMDLSGLVEVQGSSLRCSASFNKYLKELRVLEHQEESIKEFIRKTIMANNDISSICLEYLNKFKLKNRRLFFQPSRVENLKYSGVRNFLMELEIVSLQTKGVYLFSGDWIIAESALNPNLSPKLFEQIQKMKVELGEKAELLALEEEKKRLSKFPGLAQKVRQISKIIVNAGYDIESYEGDKSIRRYIEVKAVYLDAPRFYWSLNEIRKSEELKDQYWLYLVPYNGKSEFQIELIERISNPYHTIYLADSVWKSQVELLSYTKM